MRYIHPDLNGFIGPAPFTLNDVQYPRSWWRTVSPQKIAGMGFVKYEPPEPEPEPPSPEQVIEGFRLAIQRHVDSQAISRRYDSGNSLATYVNSTNPEWAAEAVAFVAWRDSVWSYAYTEMDRVLNGDREQPTIDELLEELPKMEWPE